MFSNYHNADCSFRKKLIVSFIIIFGTLSSPMKPLQYWAESAVYARLFVGGGEALAWRRRAKASHVVHRGVGRAASEHGTPEHRRLSRRQRSRCHPLADSQRHHVSLRTADIVSATRANLRSSHLCSGRGGPCRMVLGGPW